MVPTVGGELPSDRLGLTLLHEHVFILAPEVERSYPLFDEDEAVADAVRRLRAARERGVETILDLTVLGLGRDVRVLQRVAEQVDVNIVVSTGAYVTGSLPLPFVFQDPDGPLGGHEVLIEMFEQDAWEGVDGTGVRPAALKCATDVAGLTHDCMRVLRAVARVNVSTNLPVFTHSDAASQGGLEQQRVLRELGVDLERVVIGHCGDTGDLDYLRRLLDAGSTLGLDRFGLYNLCDRETRLRVVATLCAEGWAPRLILSHDTFCWSRWGDRLRAIAPDWTYTHLVDEVLPALRRLGVPEADIEQMTVGNPRRIFETGALRPRPEGSGA